MGEAAIRLTPEEEPKVRTVSFAGVAAASDLFLYERAYGQTFHPVLMSLYGSESQCRAIFAALVQYRSVSIGNVTVNAAGSGLRCRGVKVGYGKYHYTIWAERDLSNTVLVFDGDSEIDAWEMFLKNRKVPVVREWIPDLARLLVEEEMATQLQGFGASGWIVDTRDEGSAP